MSESIATIDRAGITVREPSELEPLKEEEPWTESLSSELFELGAAIGAEIFRRFESLDGR